MTFARGDHVELAERLLARIEGPNGPETVFDDGSLHRYDPASGLWRTVERDEQSRIVQSFAGERVTKPPRPLKLKASDVKGARGLAADQRTRLGFFGGAPPGLVFVNGFVRVTADGGVELLPHAAENRAQLGYPFPYDKRAPTLWLRFLHEVFRDDGDGEEKIALVQEFFGACLLGIAPTYQHCLMAIGTGSNGKSKLGDVLLACMPAGSTCSVPPQTFTSEYARALLAGKRLNVCNELPDADIVATEQFKAIVTGEPTYARQIREAPFILRSRAGHYFAANALPGTTDHSIGYWRRWIVLTFNRLFEEGKDADPEIAQRIIAEETPAIVPWLLDGGVRLVQQQAYSLPASHTAQLAQWKRTADQVAAFVDELCKEAPAGYGTLASTVYRAYQTWANENGHRYVSSTKFGMRMRDLGHPAEHCRTGNVYALRVRDLPMVAGAAAEPSRDSGGDSNDWLL